MTEFDISLSSPRGTNEAWVLHSAEISDATGNFLRNIVLSRINFRATLDRNSRARRLAAIHPGNALAG